MPITIHCATCGSEDVRRDAFAQWNVEAQQWELAELYDGASCQACDCDTSLTESRLPAPDAWSGT